MTHGDERISVVINPLSGDVWEQGLSKREYFAAMAMSGILANITDKNFFPDRIASDCTMMADKLINALNEEK
jgi:hypothetical protein